MLSISKPLNAESAEKYYDRDNYYLESQGQWYGKLANELNLSGEIVKEDFSHLLRGFERDGTTKLVESAGQKYKGTDELKHRSGIDLTLSAPKSVSILSYSDSRIEQAFQSALHSTLDHAEREFSQTRHKSKGTIRFENSENALFSTFTHRTSRELDPQLHAHCILFNLTKSKNGEVKTLHNDKFYKNKMYVGQFFRNNLATEIQKLGYQVEVTDRKQGFFEIKGVGQNVIEAFSRRSEQVKEEIKRLRELKFCNLSNENLTKWARERTGNNMHRPDYDRILAAEISKLSTSEAKVYAKWDDAELASLATTNSRIPKKNVTKEIVVSQIEKTCSQMGTSMAEIVASAKSQKRLEHEISPAIDVIRQAIEGATENQSTFKRQDILSRAMKLSIGDYSFKQIEDGYNDLQSSGTVVYLGENISSGGREKIFTTREMKSIEASIIEDCNRFIGGTDIRLDREEAVKLITDLDRFLKLKSLLSLKESDPEKAEKLFNSTVSKIADKSTQKRLTELRKVALSNTSSPLNEVIDINEEVKKHPLLQKTLDDFGSGFTPGQRNALTQIVSTEDQFSVIQGDAGVGKSFSCFYAKQLLESIGITVRGLAPTGKAADELAQAAQITHTSTLQDFILRYEHMSDEKKADTFRKGKECFIIDEASMIGSKTAQKIIAIAKELEAKVIFIGDRKQFVSIEAGNIFAELQDKSGIAKTVMNDVFRQKTNQTKDIVSAISSKDFTAAFNYLTGYTQAEAFDKSQAKNYTAGQMLCFGEDALSVPSGTIAYVSASKNDKLTINFDAEIFENNKLTKKNFTVDIDPAESKEYKNFRVFNPSEIAENPYENVIQEIPDNDVRLRAVADDYIRSTESGKVAVVITPTNDDRIELNRIIRDTLISEGKVSNGDSFTLREPFNLDGSASRFADSYKAGQVFIATKNIGLVPRGSEGRITDIDVGKNQITVEYLDAKKGASLSQSFNVSENAGKFSVFSERSSHLGVNDKIAFLKNDEFKIDGKSVRVRNGQLATIVSIDKEGNVEARIGEENKSSRKVSFNVLGSGRNGFNTLTHAYALSEMKSQGLTCDKIIWNANASKNISANSFYVSVTRCENEIAVYTNDIDSLRSKVQVEQKKESTLEYAGMGSDVLGKPFYSSLDRKEEKNEVFLNSFLTELDQKISKSNDKSISL